MRIAGGLLLLAPLLAGCGERRILPPERAERALSRTRQAHQDGRWRRVRSAAKPLLKAHPRTPGTEEALFLVADAEERRGRPTAAYRTFETLVREHPSTGRIREVSRREFALATSRYAEGKPRLKGHLWNWGIPLREVLEASARHDPYAEHAAYALLLAATCEHDAARFEEAEAVLDRMLADHPQSPWAPQGEFLRAMASYRQSKGPVYDGVPLRRAEERFRAYLERYPDGADAESARRMLILIGDRWAEHDVRAAVIYERLEQPDASGIYYRDAISRFPDSPWAERARRALAAGGKGP